MNKDLADLVEWYRLETEFFPNHVRHTKHSTCSRSRRKRVIEDWSQGEVLGYGGFGVVHKELENRTGCCRAVKTIDKRRLPTQLDCSRELLVMAILAKHESLFVKFLGWFEDRDTLYITMEYLENGHLRRYIGEPLEQETVQKITKQVLEGLDVMHRGGIAHRDLKPENIFVVSMSPVWVKLRDFGISKRIRAQDSTSSHTRVSTRVYAAPEVLSLDSPSETLEYTKAVDIWSLGCVIYELLAGSRLFPTEGAISYYFFGRWTFPEDELRRLSPTTSDSGISLIKSMVSLQPDDRPTVLSSLGHTWISDLESDSDGDISENDRETVGDLPTAKLNVRDIERDTDTIIHEPTVARSVSDIPAIVSKDDPEYYNLLGGDPVPHGSPETVFGNQQANMKESSPPPPQNPIPKGLNDIPSILAYLAKKRIHPVYSWDRTLLHWAAEKGDEEVMTMLLSQDNVNPNTVDFHGQTPLHLAAQKGHERVVKVFLTCEGINPNTTDAYGQTPLHLAAQEGREGVVKLLLARRDLNPNTVTKLGPTLLDCAAREIHGRDVREPLYFEDVDPNTPKYHAKTPLHLAAEEGHEGVVKLLLARDDVDPNITNCVGETLLHLAAKKGDERVVRVLLARADVNPNTADIYGQIPLHLAAQGRREGVVKMLLARGDVSPNTADGSDTTPLHWAAIRGHEGVVKLLLACEDVSSNRADHIAQTPLHSAAQNGHEGVVRMLLACADVNPNTADIYGQIPLHLAAQEGREGVVKMLLACGDVNPNTVTKWGKTPLHCAAMGGYEGVVRALLACEDVDPNTPKYHGKTPLWRNTTASGY